MRRSLDLSGILRNSTCSGAIISFNTLRNLGELYLRGCQTLSDIEVEMLVTAGMQHSVMNPGNDSISMSVLLFSLLLEKIIVLSNVT
jgi:hypothetical protein